MNEENEIVSSRMSRWETVVSLCWLPMHILLLPTALVLLLPKLSDGDLNFWLYAIGAAALVLFCRRFLRRDFETLCDRPGAVFLQVLVSYGLMMVGNMAAGLILDLFLPEGNPNNEAVMEIYRRESGKITAATVLLAPLLEELIFRAGVFGLFRRKNRTLAYVLSILFFAVYHVWPYALQDPRNGLYLLQYLPVSYLLCRCYERTETVWTPIFLHMLVNAVSLWMLDVLGGLGL